jgi:hypothetical protein
LKRVDDIARFELGRVEVSKVPVRRMKTLARYGAGSKAPLLARLLEPRRTATLVAVTRSLEAEAIDDALDLFALLMATRLISPARRKASDDRLAMLPKLEKASRLLSKAGRVLVEQLDLVAEANADLDPAVLWAAVTDQAGTAKEQCWPRSTPSRNWSPTMTARRRPRCGRRWSTSTTPSARS